jgi:hypothetical protein
MGNYCHCQADVASSEEIVSNSIKKYNQASLIPEKPSEDKQNQDTCITIQFLPLIDSDPSLALNLSFQSLSKGFLTRQTWNKSQLSKKLQTIARGFLERQAVNQSKSQTFSKTSSLLNKMLLKGDITKYSKLDLLSFSGKPLKQIKTVLKTEELVETDDFYYQGQRNSFSQKHGFGIEVQKDGSTFVGNFENDLKNGFGWLMFKNRNCYAGSFKDNQMTGKGKFHYKEGRTLIGNFEDGLLNGEGKEVWESGAVYKGSFVKSKKQGKGTLEIPGYSCYKGEFYKDHYHGKGTLQMENQCSYEGEWLKGKKHGTGKYSWSNGKEYIGQYFKDKKHGTGKMKYPNNTIYNGEWVDDLQHGKAIYTYFDKSKRRLRSHNSFWQFGSKIAFLTKSGEMITGG